MPRISHHRRQNMRGNRRGSGYRPAGLASLDVLAPELLLDERGQTVTTGVSSWANQGTAGGQATQATGANQPAQATINGFSALNFDGTNDSLATSGIASAFVTGTEFEGLVVVRADTVSASEPAAATAWYGERSIFQCASSASFGVSSTKKGAIVGKGSSPWDTSVFLPLYADGLPHVISFRYVGGNLIASIDGGPERSKAATSITPITGAINIGANFGVGSFFDGAVSMLMLKKTTLDAATRAQAIAFACAKYGIPAGRKRDVMWVGDSITFNSGSNWRGRIQSVAGSSYRATGALRGPSFAQDMSTSGNGWLIGTVIPQLDAIGGVNTVAADVIPILIGTNDIGGGASNATINTRYLTLLDALKTRYPNALLIAQKLMPRTDSGGIYTAQVVDWNDNYHATMVATAVGSGVNVISDDTLATLPGVTYSDGLHPDSASTNVMGDAMAVKALEWIGMVP